MTWMFKPDRPIYSQLLEQIRMNIVSGAYPPGSKLPSVRDLAMQAAVNPNTVQRALSELELSGIIYSQRTTGRYVTEDEQMIHKLKEDLAAEKIRDFLIQMKNLGYQKEEAILLIERIAKEVTV